MSRITSRLWFPRRQPPRRPGRRFDWPKRCRSRPHIEGMEDRCVPSTVTNLADAGDGSLRQAILDTPAGGTVDFQPGLTGTITLTSGELAIAKDLAITGPGADVLAVSQTPSSGARVFHITAAAATVTISGLTISNGFVRDDFGGGIYNAGHLTLRDATVFRNFARGSSTFLNGGGGIYNTGTLTITGSAISGNSSSDQRPAAVNPRSGGGGIYNDGGTVTVANSSLTGNQGDGQGGGIYNNVGTVTIADSTLDNISSFIQGYSAGQGGGIYNTAGGTVTVTRCAIDHSLAQGTTDGVSVFLSRGGGIYNAGMLAVSASIFRGNSATQGDGGAVYNTGTLTLGDTTLDGNAATLAGSGGAVYNAGTLTATNSTFSGNTATGLARTPASVLGGAGGAIANAGTLAVSNSTFHGNSASVRPNIYGLVSTGGGIANGSSGQATVTLTGVTLSGNSAGNGGGIAGGAAIRNTLIAGNRAATAPDVDGSLTSQGHNLIGDGSGGGGFAATDLVGTADSPIDPRLGPLAYNGGPTQTLALLYDSPAINAGDNAGAPLWDQRGAGFDRLSGGAIDIGAFEFQAGRAATHLALSAPAGVTAGTPFTVTVFAEDDQGGLDFSYDGQVRLTANDRGAVLPGPYTFTPQDHGVHTFSVTLSSAGSRLLTASAPQVAPAAAAVQVGGPAATFKLTGFVSPVAVGTAEVFTVTAYDANGHVAAGYRGTVALTSDDDQAQLWPDVYTFTATDAGKHICVATLFTAGRHTISVTDGFDLQGTSRPIQVTPGPVVALRIGFPYLVTRGVPFEVRVSAVDGYGNAVPGYRGTVSFASTDPLAALPADYTFTARDRGTHLFSVTFNTGEATTQGLTVSDGTLSDGNIAFVTGPAATFEIDAFAQTYQGWIGVLTVQALDADGNGAPGYRGTVHFTSTDPAAVLPVDYTFADAGRHTFQVTLYTVGNQTVGVSDVNDPAVAGASGAIEVDPGFYLTVMGFPSPVAAGTPGAFTVTAYDAFGNVATGFTGTVSFYSSDSAAVLPADYTFTAADQGVHTFAATLNTPGTHYLRAIDEPDFPAVLDGEQDGIEVTAPPGAAGRRAAADAAFALLAPRTRRITGLASAAHLPALVVTRAPGVPGAAAGPGATAYGSAGWAPVRPPRPASPEPLATAFAALPGDDWLAW